MKAAAAVIRRGPASSIHSFRTPKASSSSCRHKASHFNSKASRNRSVRPKISPHSITLNCALPTCLRYQLGVRGSSRPHPRSRQELLLGKEDGASKGGLGADCSQQGHESWRVLSFPAAEKADVTESRAEGKRHGRKTAGVGHMKNEA